MICSDFHVHVGCEVVSDMIPEYHILSALLKLTDVHLVDVEPNVLVQKYAINYIISFSFIENKITPR